MARPLLTRVVITAWIIAIISISIRVAVAHGSHSVYQVYARAGSAWVGSKPLYLVYPYSTGFYYSPLAGAFFTVFSWLPNFVGEVLWRLFFVAICFGGIRLWLNTSVRRFLSRESIPLFYLLLLPLLLPSLNNGQANCLILGLLVWAIAAAGNASWNIAAFCIAAATCLKVYPLVMGLVLALIYPRQFSWRLLLFLLGFGALSLVLQHPGYVLDQYRLWDQNSLAGNRHQWSQWIAPHDLWLLLKVLGVNPGEHGYQIIQLLSGAAIAGICLFGRLRRWPQDILLFAVFSMSCVWMILCGPATESSTYILLAPTLVLTLLHAIQSKSALWLLVWIIGIITLTVAAFGINSQSDVRDPLWMALQPFTALLLLGYVVFRTLSRKQGFAAIAEE